MKTNMWNEVQDFNWLKAEVSPHWRNMPDEQRIVPSILKSLEAAKPNVNVHATMKASGVVCTESHA